MGASSRRRLRRKITKILQIYLLYKSILNVPRARRWWVQPLFTVRDEYGGFNSLLEQYKLRHPDLYKATLRVDPQQFDHLLGLVKADIEKIDTNMRSAISPSQRLSITLLFLATGDSVNLISIFFRLVMQLMDVLNG